MSDERRPATLSATYVSPKEQKAFTSAISTTVNSTSSTGEKTAYLTELRQHVSQMQADINVFLTHKMDQDKAVAEGSGQKGKGVDEDKEEEMYGEEDPENDG